MAEKFARVWEKKNSKVARAGGVSLMALSLAACGSSSTTPAPTTPVADADPEPTPDPVPTPTPAGKTLELKEGDDVTETLVGGDGNDEYSGTADFMDSAGNADSFVDPNGSDADTLVLSDDEAMAAHTITDIETVTVNIGTTAAAATDVDASNFTGVDLLTVNMVDLTIGGQVITGNKDIDIASVDASDVAKIVTGAGAKTLDVTQATKAGITVDADTVSGATKIIGAATVTAAGAGTGDQVTVEAFDNADAGTAAKAKIENAKDVSITTNAATVLVDDSLGGDANSFTGNVTVVANSAGSVTVDNGSGGGSVTATKASTTSAQTTIKVMEIDDSGFTITAGAGVKNGKTAIQIDGSDTDGTTDAATISASGLVSLDASNGGGADLVDNLTLSGNGAAVEYEIAGGDSGAATTKYTLTGSQDVTLLGQTSEFTLTTVTDSTTAGTTTVRLDVVAASDLSKVAADVISVEADSAGGDVVLGDGANLQIAKDQTNLTLSGKSADFEVSIASADDTSASGAAILIELDAVDVSDNIKTFNIDATVGGVDADSITVGTTGTINVTGSKAVDLGDVTAKTFNAGTSTGAITINANSTALTTITTGSGDDDVTADLGAKYAVDLKGGDNTLVIENALDASSFVTGDGKDDITIKTGNAYVVTSGDGNDTVTIASNVSLNSILVDAAGSTDVLLFEDTNGEDLSSNSNFAFSGFETVNVAALSTASITISSAQFNDQTFTLKGGATTDNLTVKGTASAENLNVSTITVDTASVTVNAGDGDDVVTGTASADTLNGEAGADTINAGKGGDTLSGGAGADILNGGEGDDTVSYAGAADVTETGDDGTQTGVAINLSASSVAGTTILGTNSGYIEKDIGAVESNSVVYLYADASANYSEAKDVLSSIENATGSDGNDYIIGSAAANTLTGGAGVDYIIGGGGADTIALTEGAASIDVVHFTSTADFGDTITGMAIGTGAGKDDITLANSFDSAGLTGAVTFRTAVAFNTDETTTLTDLTTDAGTDAEGYIVELTGSTLGATLYAAVDTALAAGAAATGAGFVLLDNGADAALLYDADLTTAGDIVLVATLDGITDITGGTDVVIL